MLKIHHNLHLPIPRTTHSTRHVELSPVVPENDELIMAIEQEARGSDSWVLEGSEDAEKLDTFWAGVASDLKKDPDWFDFAND
ncbi:hypothetical protein EOL96_05520 [Candidatus Saccharibacteria bacterium]|nr:hypothetical protein [Candidatus Saccharibacteria bacterium]